MRMTHGRMPLALGLAGAMLLTACGGGPEPTPAASPPADTRPDGREPDQGPAVPSPVQIELEAEDISFDQESMTAPAGVEVTMEFKNRDEVPHNFALYESEEAQNEIFSGEIIEEGETTYRFQTPEESGEYFFRCDVHPQEMTGTFVVA